MKTSVVISTYNGEEYIVEQLESIRTQTVEVDEVLIFDDCSMDKTSQLILSFIAKYGLSSWKLLNNEQNQGFFKNFINGLYITSGDIIFFSDQDDIWLPNKIERTLELFSQHSDMFSLTSTFSRFNNGKILCSHVTHPRCKKEGLKKISIHDFCKFDSYLGMATAIRRSLVDTYDFRKCNFYTAHDRMVNFAAITMNGLYHIDEVLVKRRSYPESVSNKINSGTGGDQIKQLDFILSRLSSHSEFLELNQKEDENKAIIKSYTIFASRRKNIILKKDILGWVSLLPNISKYNRPSHYLEDGLFIFKSLFR